MSRGVFFCEAGQRTTERLSIFVCHRSVLRRPPMSDIPIRPAAPRDIAAITRIYDHAVRHGTASFELEPPDEAEMARRLAARCSPAAFPIWWPSIDGDGRRLRLCRALPGAAGLSLDASRIRSTSTRGCSGRGIGRALLERLIVEARGAQASGR